jgi:drug/metabolite transporter (DMT)-like permease
MRRACFENFNRLRDIALVLLSPLIAILLCWRVAGETFTSLQLLGVALVLMSVGLSQLFAAANGAKQGCDAEPRIRAQ